MAPAIVPPAWELGRDGRVGGRSGDVLVGEPDRPPAYQQIRVGFGSSGPWSSVVNLANDGPPTMTNLQGPQAGGGNIVKPVDTGIDQAQVSVQVLDNNNSALPNTDPSYQLLYYRQGGSSALVTNLFPRRRR